MNNEILRKELLQQAIYDLFGLNGKKGFLEQENKNFEIRKEQQHAVKEVVDAFISNPKHILMEAPTGTGKTFIYSYIALMDLGIATALKLEPKNIVIVTNNKSLQKQLTKDLKENIAPNVIKYLTKSSILDTLEDINMSRLKHQLESSLLSIGTYKSKSNYICATMFKEEFLSKREKTKDEKIFNEFLLENYKDLNPKAELNKKLKGLAIGSLDLDDLDLDKCEGINKSTFNYLFSTMSCEESNKNFCTDPKCVCKRGLSSYKIMIMNYDYLFRLSQVVPLNFIETLILDECHNIPSKLMNCFSEKFSLKSYKNKLEKLKKRYGDLSSLEKQITNVNKLIEFTKSDMPNQGMYATTNKNLIFGLDYKTVKDISDAENFDTDTPFNLINNLDKIFKDEINTINKYLNKFKKLTSKKINIELSGVLINEIDLLIKAVLKQNKIDIDMSNALKENRTRLENFTDFIENFNNFIKYCQENKISNNKENVIKYLGDKINKFSLNTNLANIIYEAAKDKNVIHNAAEDIIFETVAQLNKYMVDNPIEEVNQIYPENLLKCASLRKFIIISDEVNSEFKKRAKELGYSNKNWLDDNEREFEKMLKNKNGSDIKEIYSNIKYLAGIIRETTLISRVTNDITMYKNFIEDIIEYRNYNTITNSSQKINYADLKNMYLEKINELYVKYNIAALKIINLEKVTNLKEADKNNQQEIIINLVDTNTRFLYEDFLGNLVSDDGETVYIPKIIYSSATMTTSDKNGYDYFKKMLNLENRQTFEVSEIKSPFKLENRQWIMLTKKMTFNKDNPKDKYYGKTLLKNNVSKMITENPNGTLILTTTQGDVYDIYNNCKDLNDVNIFSQYETSLKTAIKTVKESSLKTVIIGSSGLWEGIDIKGDDLTTVIISKLPYSQVNASNNNAYFTKALINDLITFPAKTTFSNEFWSWYKNDMAITFYQGIGRLIRSKSDYGVIIFMVDATTIGYNEKAKGNASELGTDIKWKKFFDLGSDKIQMTPSGENKNVYLANSMDELITLHKKLLEKSKKLQENSWHLI